MDLALAGSRNFDRFRIPLRICLTLPSCRIHDMDYYILCNVLALCSLPRKNGHDHPRTIIAKSSGCAACCCDFYRDLIVNSLEAPVAGDMRSKMQGIPPRHEKSCRNL